MPDNSQEQPISPEKSSVEELRTTSTIRTSQNPRYFEKLFRFSMLGALLTALVLANVIWLAWDTLPFSWDESIHYLGAIGYYEALTQAGGPAWGKILHLSNFYPPLQELLTGCVFLITGPSPDIAAFMDVFYISAILALLWLLGRRLFGEATGILAGFLFMAAAGVVVQSKYFMLDIPLVFWVCLGFYAFIRSEGFMQRRWVILYGATFGLALLTKWSAIFFLALPPLVTGLTAIFRRARGVSQLWLNLAIAYVLAALLAAPWYMVHLIKLIHNTSGYFYTRGALENDPLLSSPASWCYYLLGLFQQLSWPAALLVLSGLVFFVFRRRYLVLWLVWVGSPYLILTLIRNKDYRYTLPLLPLLCLAGTGWISEVREPWRRRITMGLAIGLLLQFTYMHIGPAAGGLHRLCSKQWLGLPIINSLSPSSQQWPLAAILADVAHLGRNLEVAPVLRVIPGHPSFSRVVFAVERSRSKTAVRLTSTRDWPAFTDFAVTKTKGLGLPFAIKQAQAITQALADPDTRAGQRFELVRQYALPDGSDALLYRRNEIMSAEPAEEIKARLHREINRLLSNYLKDVPDLTISIEAWSPEETRLGRFRKIQIKAANGRLGDFKHKAFGVPFQSLEIEMSNLSLDLTGLAAGEILPLALEEIKLQKLELYEPALNQTLAEQNGETGKWRIIFSDQKLHAQRLGQIPVQVQTSLKVAPDREEQESDNLWFNLQRVRIGWLTLPGWLAQPMLEDFNCLFKLSGFPVRVKLGTLKIRQNWLRLGEQI